MFENVGLGTDMQDDGIDSQLGTLVDLGLLAMGVTAMGEVLFWATEMGAQMLGMTLPAA